MRKQRSYDIIRNRLSVLYNALEVEKEVSRALSEALQDQMMKNQILEDLLEAQKAE